jgi:hypothetical protein
MIAQERSAKCPHRLKNDFHRTVLLEENASIPSTLRFFASELFWLSEISPQLFGFFRNRLAEKDIRAFIKSISPVRLFFIAISVV